MRLISTISVWGQIRLSHKFRRRALEQSPLIPLPPSLPATRGEKGDDGIGYAFAKVQKVG